RDDPKHGLNGEKCDDPSGPKQPGGRFALSECIWNRALAHLGKAHGKGLDEGGYAGTDEEFAAAATSKKRVACIAIH
ncbi:MAG: hypothetical protein ACK5D7_01035, partial [Planctomycetota bacterium]